MNYDVISRHRKKLMGAAIVLILLRHIQECYEVHGLHEPFLVRKLAEATCGVDIFFLLSGVGLFYSYTRSRKAGPFYLKRAIRCLPSYFAVAVPYWIIRDVFMDKRDAARVAYDLFFVSFFREGTRRFWFVAAIIAFYLVFPLLYRAIMGGGNAYRRAMARAYVLIGGAVVLNAALAATSPGFGNISVMMQRLPVFILGILWGYRSYHGVKVRPAEGCAALVLFFLVEAVNRMPGEVWGAVSVHISYYRLSLMGVILTWVLSAFFSLVRWDRFQAALEKLGGITLEVYLLHSALKNLFDYPHALIPYCGICILLPVVMGHALHVFVNNSIARRLPSTH